MKVEDFSDPLFDFVSCVGIYVKEYAKKIGPSEKSGTGFGHADNILAAVKLRAKYAGDLKEHYALLSDADRAIAKEATLDLFKEVNYYDTYEPSDVEKLVDEAFSLAAGITKNVLPVTERFDLQPDRPFEPSRRYYGPLDASTYCG